jgi:hypothetical protein
MPIAAGQSEQLLGTVGEIAVNRSARPVCERSGTVRPMTMMSESGIAWRGRCGVRDPADLPAAIPGAQLNKVLIAGDA